MIRLVLWLWLLVAAWPVWAAPSAAAGGVKASSIIGLAPSATVDTTNAANITSGTLNAARLPAVPASGITGVVPATQGGAGSVSGVLKGNGSGVVSTAVPGTDFDAAGAAAAAQSYATNASNISSGTLNAARLPAVPASGITGVVPATQGGAGSVSGVLKGNGSGVVSTAVPGTDFDAAGAAAAAQSYATNASNISSGTLNAARLPASVNTLGSFSTLVALQTAYPAASYGGYLAYPQDQSAPFFSNGAGWYPVSFPLTSQSITLADPGSGQYAPGGNIYTFPALTTSTAVAAPNASILHVTGTTQALPSHSIAALSWYYDDLTGAFPNAYQGIVNEAKASITSGGPSFLQFYEANLAQGNAIGSAAALNAHISTGGSIGTIGVYDAVRLSLDTNQSGTISTALRGVDFNISNHGTSNVSVAEFDAIFLPNMAAENIANRFLIKSLDPGALMTTAGPLLETTGDSTITSFSNGGSTTLPSNVNEVVLFPSGTVAGQTINFPSVQRAGMQITLRSSQLITSVVWATPGNTIDAGVNQITTIVPGVSYVFRLTSVNGSLVWLEKSNEVKSTTFAAMTSLTPTAYIGRQFLVTDVGQNGSIWTSTGSYFSAASPITHAVDNTGYLLPGVSAGTTVSQSGTTVTVTNGGGTPVAHNIPSAGYTGFWVYFPGSTHVPAGWYSGFAYGTTTAYTFSYATSQSVSSESVNGGSAYVGTDTVVQFQATPNKVTGGINIPAGALGMNGSLFADGDINTNASAGAKTVKFFMGSTQVAIFNGGTTTVQSDVFNIKFQNAGSLSVNRLIAGGTGGSSGTYFSSANSSVLASPSAINTGVATTFGVKLNVAWAQDYLALVTLNVQLTNAN